MVRGWAEGGGSHWIPVRNFTISGNFASNPSEAEAIVERIHEAVRARSAATDADVASRMQIPPAIATPDVYKSQFGERSKNWGAYTYH